MLAPWYIGAPRACVAINEAAALPVMVVTILAFLFADIAAQNGISDAEVNACTCRGSRLAAHGVSEAEMASKSSHLIMPSRRSRSKSNLLCAAVAQSSCMSCRCDVAACRRLLERRQQHQRIRRRRRKNQAWRKQLRFNAIAMVHGYY